MSHDQKSTPVQTDPQQNPDSTPLDQQLETDFNSPQPADKLVENPSFSQVLTEIKSRGNLPSKSKTITIDLQMSIRFSSTGFPHFTQSHPPTILPVVQTNPTPKLIGVLELTAPSGRPDSYSRQTLATAATKTPFGIHRDATEVFIIPKQGAFVCFAEDTIVYRLPGHTEEQDGTTECGLQSHEFPIYSNFYPITEFNIRSNLEQVKAQLEAIDSLSLILPQVEISRASD